ncbi:MAG: SpoIIIAH-like family protein [Alicyclobacillaceae bacterium]|nr:SpoIIIAH-like family protein [Alicyclobacillaceae bacterium]
MVKRQTVWLSTMMVLSLMLIGYYTMNSGSETASSAGTETSPPVTAVNNPPASHSSGASGDTGGTQATSASDASSPANAEGGSSDDFFVIQQTSVTAQITRNEDRLMQVLSNDNASQADIANAEQQLKKLQSWQGGIESAEEEIKGDGYLDCAIVPNADYSEVKVYVRSKSPLTKLDAAKIMDIVSEQLNFPMENIVVKSHG